MDDVATASSLYAFMWSVKRDIQAYRVVFAADRRAGRAVPGGWPASIGEGTRALREKAPFSNENGAFYGCTLLGYDGLGGAVGSAGAAVHAGIGVDDVLGIALGNGLDGAVLSAGAAADAGVGDSMCHE